MSNPVFSATDANDLIAIAQEAPIPGGARMAIARQELYQKFMVFYKSATAEPEAEAPKTRKPRTKTLENIGGYTPPADGGDVEDLTK